MSRIAKYILNSDFATLANDSETTTITLDIPATNITFPNVQTYSASATVGTAGAPFDCDINCDMTTHRWVGRRLNVVEKEGSANEYQFYIFVQRDSPTSIRVHATVYKTLMGTTAKNARTITVRVRTFLPPFD